MIGILVLTHGSLARQFIETARLIGLNSEVSLSALCIDPADPPDLLRDRVEEAIKRVKADGGALVLTDLFGGTPTNLSLSFLQDGEVEVVTGLNLPMLIKAINARENNDLRSLARAVVEAGKENIFLAGELLRTRLSRGNSGKDAS